MSQAPQLERTADGTALREFTSPRAKLVYLYLDVVGTATVDDLKDELGMQRLDLFGVLDTLCETEHVRRDGERYVAA